MPQILLRNHRPMITFSVLSLFVLAANVFVTQSGLFIVIPFELSLAVIIDLMICIPVVFYLTIVRGYQLPVWTVVPVMLIGVFLFRLLLPEHDLLNSNGASLLVFILGAVVLAAEFLFVYMLFRKLILLVRNYREARKTFYFFTASFQKACEQTFGTWVVSRLLATDLSVWYYSMFAWRKSLSTIPGTYRFSYHKETGYLAFVLMLAHALAIEIIGVHMMVAYAYNSALAWLVTVFDLFFLAALIADYRAMMLSPVTADQHALHIQKGIRQSAHIPYVSIESIETAGGTLDTIKKQKDALHMYLPEMIEEVKPQMEITLKNSVYATGLYGRKKCISKIYISVDNPQEFKNFLEEKIQKMKKSL
ncbi:hypothetical protein GJU40_17085 [Bacillus lacus]|uniref:Beta-carotene 15,15'-monooxygenase n=1 Tax=Metabacillus lacus TaxID=1983721 RepID=A0A7X2J1Y7_9BACI|nr:hypothetical protein [Metabacillus lacus]MRX73860.1 hypothetical protein [Metabacillus lacus]